MSKKSTRGFKLLLVAIVMVGVSLACNGSDPEMDIIDELVEEGEGYTREEELEFFENYTPDRIYTVTESDIEDPCDRGYSAGEAVPIRILHQADSQNWANDTIMLEYLDQPHRGGVVALNRVAPLSFCGYTYDYSSGRKLEYWECLSFSSSGYLHTIEHKDKECYSAHAVFNPSAEAAESELANQAAEATQAAAAEATLAAEAEATLAAEAEATLAAEATRRAGDASEYPIEDCLASSSDYSWDITAHEIVPGDGVTACKYTFVVQNNSDEDQNLIIYETHSTGSGGMKSEGWHTRHIGAHDSYEMRCSYVDYYGRGGDFTWSYPTSMLIARSVPPCFWLTVPDDPNNMALWEQHSVTVENPCQ